MSSERLVVRNARSTFKVALLGVGCVVILGVGVALTMHELRAGLIFLAISTTVLGLYARTLLDSSPKLIVTEQDLYLPANKLRLAWTDIRSITTRNVTMRVYGVPSTHKYLCIDVADPKALGRWMNMVSKLNLGKLGDVGVDCTAFDHTPEQILGIIATIRPRRTSDTTATDVQR